MMHVCLICCSPMGHDIQYLQQKKMVYMCICFHRFYGYAENFERLLTIVANDIIVVSRGLLPEDLFQDTEMVCDVVLYVLLCIFVWLC